MAASHGFVKGSPAWRPPTGCLGVARMAASHGDDYWVARMAASHELQALGGVLDQGVDDGAEGLSGTRAGCL
jgi:hypothetical protein